VRGADGDVIRRRKPAEAPEPDRLHFNDPLGTIKGQSKPTRPANPVETYTMSAEGEPLEAQTTDMPSNIRFHGGSEVRRTHQNRAQARSRTRSA